MKKISQMVLLFGLVLFLAGCKNGNGDKNPKVTTSEENKKCDYIKDYYPLIYTAEVEYYLGNHQNAFDFYQKAFEVCEPKNSSLHYEMDKFAELAAILGKSNLALGYIERNLKQGMLLRSYTNDSVFNTVLQSERGKKLIRSYDVIRKEYLDGLNLELREEIQRMIAADQRFRRTNAYYTANLKRADSIDEIHEQRLIEMFEETGYPNEKLIGGFNVDMQRADAGTLLLHTEDSIRMNYFVPKLKDFVRDGLFPPKELGAIIDQFYRYNGEPQIYGTYSAQGGGYAEMIEDREKVDRNRKSIGLPPLAMQEKLDSLKGF